MFIEMQECFLCLLIFKCLFQFSVSVSKENSRTAEVLESISRNVRVKPENLRLAEVRLLWWYRFYVKYWKLDTPAK